MAESPGQISALSRPTFEVFAQLFSSNSNAKNQQDGTGPPFLQIYPKSHSADAGPERLGFKAREEGEPVVLQGGAGS